MERTCGGGDVPINNELIETAPSGNQKLGYYSRGTLAINGCPRAKSPR